MHMPSSQKYRPLQTLCACLMRVNTTIERMNQKNRPKKKILHEKRTGYHLYGFIHLYIEFTLRLKVLCVCAVRFRDFLTQPLSEKDVFSQRERVEKKQTHIPTPTHPQ